MNGMIRKADNAASLIALAGPDVAGNPATRCRMQPCGASFKHYSVRPEEGAGSQKPPDLSPFPKLNIATSTLRRPNFFASSLLSM